MSAPFKYYFSNEGPFLEKRGVLIPGRRSSNISRQKEEGGGGGGEGGGRGGASSREALFRTYALFRVNAACERIKTNNKNL